MKKDKPASRFEEFLAEIAARNGAKRNGAKRGGKMMKSASSGTSLPEPDFFSASPESFEQPVMTPDVQLRIERLAHIAKSIERNLVSKPSPLPAGRKFKIDFSSSIISIDF